MKRFKVLWISILIIVIPVLSSCSLQKRHYRRGYYILCMGRTSESIHRTNNLDSSELLLNDADYSCKPKSSIDSTIHIAIAETEDSLSSFNTPLARDIVTAQTDSGISLELVAKRDISKKNEKSSKSNTWLWACLAFAAIGVSFGLLMLGLYIPGLIFLVCATFLVIFSSARIIKNVSMLKNDTTESNNDNLTVLILGAVLTLLSAVALSLLIWLYKFALVF